MAIAATISSATKTHSLHTATLSGLANNTQYVLKVTTSMGGTANIPFTSDGSGNATVSYMPSPSGTTSYELWSVGAKVAGPVTQTCPGE